MNIPIFLTSFLCFFIGLNLSSCGTFAEPENTTSTLVYPPPLIDKVRISNQTVEITISSYVQSGTDFSNYNLFIAPLNENIKAVEKQDITLMETFDEMSYYFTNTDKPTNSSTGFQRIVYTNTNYFQTKQQYQFGATCYGISEFHAKVGNHNGWLQSTVSIPIVFYVGSLYELSIQNHHASPNNSSLIITNETLMLTAVSITSPNLTTSPMTFYLDFYHGEIKLLMISGLSNENGIQNKGSQEDFYEAQLPPTEGYLRQVSIPLEPRHLYFLKTPQGYVKFQTTNSFPEWNSNTQSITNIRIRACLLLGTNHVAF